MEPKDKGKKKRKNVIPLSNTQVDSIRKVNQILSCCKCGGDLQQPYHLKCDHCICQKCFDSLQKIIVVCPICKKRTNRKDIRFDPIYSNLSTHFEELKQQLPSPKSIGDSTLNQTVGDSTLNQTVGDSTPNQSVTDSTPNQSVGNSHPIETVEDSNPISQNPVSVYGLKQNVRSQSPLHSPKTNNPLSHTLEIISDSSNDAFTYMCTHPQLCLPSPSKRNSEVLDTKLTRKRSRLSRSSTDELESSFLLSDYMIITSSLSDKCIEKIREFATKYKVMWKSEFPFQTHQIDGSTRRSSFYSMEMSERMSSQGQKYILIIRHQDGWCKRTVKYMYAIACGAWIVGMEWIEASLSAKKVLHPSKYEITGDSKTKVANVPRSSRLDHEKGNHGIFNNVFFLIRIQDSRNGIPMNILIDLLQRCGCVQDYKDVSSRGKGMKIIEVVDRLTAHSGLDVVTVDMLLNCIGSWKGLYRV